MKFRRGSCCANASCFTRLTFLLFCLDIFIAMMVCVFRFEKMIGEVLRIARVRSRRFAK